VVRLGAVGVEGLLFCLLTVWVIFILLVKIRERITYVFDFYFRRYTPEVK
jgi:hypothetical protein